jgi:preprotein translocase subunit SecG
MVLERVDWLCIFGFFGISLVIGIIVSKKAGRSSSEFRYYCFEESGEELF